MYKYLFKIFEFNEHPRSSYWSAPFSDLPSLIAHYTERVTLLNDNYPTSSVHYVERGALLYRNLSNCFDSTLHWKGHSFAYEFFQS